MSEYLIPESQIDFTFLKNQLNDFEPSDSPEKSRRRSKKVSFRFVSFILWFNINSLRANQWSKRLLLIGIYSLPVRLSYSNISLDYLLLCVLPRQWSLVNRFYLKRQISANQTDRQHALIEIKGSSHSLHVLSRISNMYQLKKWHPLKRKIPLIDFGNQMESNWTIIARRLPIRAERALQKRKTKKRAPQWVSSISV